MDLLGLESSPLPDADDPWFASAAALEAALERFAAELGTGLLLLLRDRADFLTVVLLPLSFWSSLPPAVFISFSFLSPRRAFAVVSSATSADLVAGSFFFARSDVFSSFPFSTSSFVPSLCCDCVGVASAGDAA